MLRKACDWGWLLSRALVLAMGTLAICAVAIALAAAIPAGVLYLAVAMVGVWP